MPDNYLFQPLDPFARKVLDSLPFVLERIAPQTASQRRDLPKACRDLSVLLTQEREELHRPYWISPRLTSAYLRYFLPWNLLRMGALLPGLNLDGLGPKPLVADLGSGPLTLGLALWLSRPDLRAQPLVLLATDSSPQPLDLGKRLFKELIQIHQPDCPWTIHTLRAPLSRVLAEIKGKPDLICLGNVLNEWTGNKGQSAIAENLRKLIQNCERHLTDNGQILAIEPGTRLGGKLIVQLRQAALSGFFALSPCPHNEACPMLAGQHTAWCHFNHRAAFIPNFLEKLSRQAGLGKQNLSLSFVHLRLEQGHTSQKRTTEELYARVVSNPFTIPNQEGHVCYLCTRQGLGLLQTDRIQPSGALLQVSPAGKRDPKSGAQMMVLANPSPTA